MPFSESKRRKLNPSTEDSGSAPSDIKNTAPPEDSKKPPEDSPAASRPLSTPAPKMSDLSIKPSSKPQNSDSFLAALAARRSYYPLTPKSSISDKKIQEIIETVVKHVPSSFNSQSTRVVLLLKKEHERLWDMTRDVLKGVTKEEKWESTKKRMEMFRGAYGTILFFNNRPSIQKMQQTYPAYAERFPTWAAESNAMHQYALWTALELEGMGANLQHYNPLIDEKVQEMWGVSSDWELQAELVFGVVEEGKGPGMGWEKGFEPLEGRVRVFGGEE